MTGAARLHRSELAVPGIQERFFPKAAASAADAVFLDLEDAVAPAAKDAARGKVVEALNSIEWGLRLMAVRVNALDTPWALRDIVDVARSCPRLDVVVLPKAESAFDVRHVAALLRAVELETGRTRPPVGISVLLETAKGIVRADEIAGASDRLEAMVFGVGDYSSDLRTPDTVFGRPSADYAVLTDADAAGHRALHWNDQWHYALARVVNACRAHGLRPIDGPYTDYRDAEGFAASARRARALGFEGKWAIHPSQVEGANAAFSPPAEQVRWARGVLEALDAAAAAGGGGAVGMGGALVDLAHARRAREIMARAELIRQRDGGNG